MQHRNLRTRASATAKRFALTTAVAAAMFGTIATTTAFTSDSATPATARPAAARLVTVKVTARSAAAKPATKPARPESALARAFRKYFRHQAATGMTAWIKSGVESSNEAILMQARGDAYPHRNAALPADSAALAASARNGLSHPSPVDKAGWDKIMRDEITIAKELPIPAEGNAATAEAPIIKYDYLAFAHATS